MRKALTVVGERMIHELRGLSCLPLDLVPASKGYAVTRSFSGRVTDRETLEQAVAAHATRLGEKLRREPSPISDRRSGTPSPRSPLTNAATISPPLDTTHTTQHDRQPH